MKINEPAYQWAYALTPRSLTTHLILHHAAGNGTVETIHAYHLSKGWAGIAYHYYVRKDGTIYRGRPENMRGGHTTNWNYCSIGVCFEGDFQTEEMSASQIKAGQELLADIVRRYPTVVIGRHCDFGATSCPGKNFPFDTICDGADPEPASGDVEAIPAWKKNIYEKALANKLITDTGWLDKLDEPAPVWLVLELANRLKGG